MFRKAGWLAVWGTLMAGSAAFGQGPGAMYPAPGASGYPGYPTPGYDPLLPVPFQAPGNNPTWPGLAPNLPFGYGPMSGPSINPAPMGPMPAPVRSLPNYDGIGPKAGVSEPYVVPRETAPGGPNPIYQPGPAFLPPAGLETASYVQAVPPSEPYALYEGPRYAADVKVDDTRFWAQASYIHWWVNRGNTPPLLTAGSLNDPIPGALGQPNTSVLLGGGGLGPDEFSGIQASFGMWLDPEKTHAIELAGFYVGKNSQQASIGSSAAGSPFLAIPVIVAGTGAGAGENALSISSPGALAGTATVNNIMNFFGAEFNYITNAFRLNGWSVDYFGGVRYLYLNDNLSLDQNVTVLSGGVGLLPFNGVTQPAGSNFLFHDSFNATNDFYGGQIGARVSWTACNWELGAIMKLGLGATTHNVIIDGTTTLNATNGTSTTASGGTFAQASNIGQHTSTDFSVVPELDLTVSYHVTCWLRIFAGYNLLYWTNVERAGDQIDRHIDFSQVPTDGAFVPGKVGTAPTFPNARSDFWAQGFNLGFELTF